MFVWVILGEAAFLFLFLFSLLFFIHSLWEKERRAVWLSALCWLGLVIIDAGVFLIHPDLRPWVLGGVFFVSGSILARLMLSPKPRTAVEILGGQEKIDERDVIFARYDLLPGSLDYLEYYQRRPEFKQIDDEIRKLPDVLSSSHLEKEPVLLSLAEAEFDFLEQLVTLVDGEAKKKRKNLSSAENTLAAKKILTYLGAAVSGVCEVEQSHVYSHVGRGPEPYGSRIEMTHKFALVFAVEMDWDMIACAPGLPVIVETGRRYVEAARISIITAQLIRHLGHSARAHVAGSNYQAMLTPLAWKAGLGELGRLGILMTPKHGPRIRLGLVTTDLPLVLDKPVVFGVQDFCLKCKKCALNCPAQAIPAGGKTLENGVEKWTIQREACYRFWRKCGTDCARCIFVCPYSKPDSFFHRIIRKAAAHSKAFQSAALVGDSVFYGRFPRSHPYPFSV